MWIDSGRKKSQEGQAFRVLHSRESDVRIRIKNKCGVARILGEFTNLKLAQRRIAVLSNTIQRNRSFQHVTCDEKVVYMKTGKAFFWKIYQCPRLLRAVLTPIRSENIRRPSKQTEREVWGNSSHAFRRKFAERSTRRLVAVTLITEYKVYLTQQSRKKTLIARKW